VKLFLLFTETGEDAKRKYLSKFGDIKPLFEQHYLCYPNEKDPDLIFINNNHAGEIGKVLDILNSFKGRVFVWLHKSRNYTPRWINLNKPDIEYYCYRSHSCSGPVAEALEYLGKKIESKSVQNNEYYFGLIKLSDAFYNNEHVIPKPRTKIRIKYLLKEYKKDKLRQEAEEIYKKI